jgi:hypothetical protein
MNDAFPSKYLKAEDLEDGDLIVTIKDAEFVDFTDPRTQKSEPKPILHFTGDNKPLVLNKTNYKVISGLMGSDDTDDWAGRQIALYATEVESFGETVLGIRVRLNAPTKAKSAKATSQARRDALKTPEEIAATAPDADDLPF